jgi:threonine/homoserine/homoserine lactone efflux protein
VIAVPSAHTILLFMTAGLALNLTPGPDMLFVAAQGTAGGRRTGLAAAAGIFLGCMVHIGAVALGLATLLAHVPAAYDAVRWVGAAYLVFLGARALLSRSPLEAATSAPARTPWHAVLQGAGTNILNPKVALFFLAFVPQFVDPRRGPPAAQIVVLGMLFNTTGLLVNATVGWLASRATEWLRVRPGPGRALQRITGGVFIALGVRLALLERR